MPPEAAVFSRNGVSVVSSTAWFISGQALCLADTRRRCLLPLVEFFATRKKPDMEEEEEEGEEGEAKPRMHCLTGGHDCRAQKKSNLPLRAELLFITRLYARPAISFFV